MNRPTDFKTTITDEAGFSLIELVLVIAVLGILAAIALFGSQGFRERASDLCQSNNDRMEWTVEQAQTIASHPEADHYDVAPGDCDASLPGNHPIFLAPARTIDLLPARPVVT